MMYKVLFAEFIFKDSGSGFRGFLNLLSIFSKPQNALFVRRGGGGGG